MAHTAIFDSQTNVRQTIIDALNLAVPRQYKRTNTPNQIGAKIYKANYDPRRILGTLRYNYGKVQPSGKTRKDTFFNAPWATKDHTKTLVDRLEECFVFVMITRLPYTQDQLMDNVLLVIQLTGAYELATQEWIGFTAQNKTWHQLKAHFTEAYNVRLATGAGTAGMAG